MGHEKIVFVGDDQERHRERDDRLLVKLKVASDRFQGSRV